VCSKENSSDMPKGCKIHTAAREERAVCKGDAKGCEVM
jgi:hypothetical protein